MVDRSTRMSSPHARLARLGFRQAEASWAHLQGLADDLPDVVIEALAAAPDPDLAVASLAAIAEAAPKAELMTALANDSRLRERLAAVLGSSEGLGEFLVRHPESVDELADPALAGPAESSDQARLGLLAAVGAEPDDVRPTAGLAPAAAADALRVDYYRRLVRLAAQDLSQRWSVDQSGAALADLAAGTLEASRLAARSATSSATPSTGS